MTKHRTGDDDGEARAKVAVTMNGENGDTVIIAVKCANHYEAIMFHDFLHNSFATTGKATVVLGAEPRKPGEKP